MNDLKLIGKEELKDIYFKAPKNVLYEEKIDDLTNDDEKLFEFFGLKSGSIEDAKIWSNFSVWENIRNKFVESMA